MEDQEQFTRLRRLLEEAPEFVNGVQPTANRIWLGKGYALVVASGDTKDAARFKTVSDYISHGGDPQFAHEAFDILYRALALAELKAPASAQGAFIGAGNAFDALAALAKVFESAKSVVRIVDPYMDAKAVTDVAVLVKDGVAIELLADSATVKGSLGPAVKAYKSQYGGKRPIEVRLAAAKSLHDRLIIVDGSTPWTLTQSLNALATRSPASIVKIEGDSVGLKIAAYDAFWTSGTPLP
ncbi:Uncharacterized protein MLTONO_1726 [Mesorhizobium loti]|nr:Uncharacterized protein MLTONO_1726 [Mesorhizobium loti]